MENFDWMLHDATRHAPQTTRSGDHTFTPFAHECEESIRAKLQDVLNLAHVQGFIVTVELVPERPLAMGNYRMIGRVRGMR
jgi:hypothetical protein